MPNHIEIPSEFQCFGMTVKVIWSDTMFSEQGNLGFAHYDSNTIYLQTNTHGYARTHDQLVATFIHEMMHILLHNLGYRKRANDEKFIEQISGLIHQALTSAVYPVTEEEEVDETEDEVTEEPSE